MDQTKNFSELSDLAKIDLKSNDPVELYCEWHNDARKYSKGSTTVICLSTVNEASSRQYQPRGRHVLLRKYDSNGFVFFTDSRGRKSQELNKNNNAAASIYWVYTNDNNERVCKQVRLEGKVEMLPRDETESVYNEEPLYSKIRSHLCHQDTTVDWDELKKRHDELLLQAKANKNFLPMPDHHIGYRLIPTWMDFYFSKDYFIADRIEFEKDITNNTWNHRRIAA